MVLVVLAILSGESARGKDFFKFFHLGIGIEIDALYSSPSFAARGAHACLCQI